jgi:hypothetical protein
LVDADPESEPFPLLLEVLGVAAGAAVGVVSTGMTEAASVLAGLAAEAAPVAKMAGELEPPAALVATAEELSVAAPVAAADAAPVAVGV